MIVSEVEHLGFSGSRYGMTEKQKEKARHWLIEISIGGGAKWLHHGLCIGADTTMHYMAKDDFGFKIHGHPPLDPKYTENGLVCNRTDPPWSYRGRNQRIVKASQLLIATPRSLVSQHSGTWTTINMAKLAGVPFVVIAPDGTEQVTGDIQNLA